MAAVRPSHSILQTFSQTLLLALSLFLLQYAVGISSWDAPLLRERLGLVSAGFFLVFAGSLVSALHWRLLLAVAFVAVPIAWTNAWSFDAASRYLVPGIAGAVFGIVLHFLIHEGALWPTSKKHNGSSDEYPTPRPVPNPPIPSADNHSRYPGTSVSSGANKAISPPSKERSSPPTTPA